MTTSKRLWEAPKYAIFIVICCLAAATMCALVSSHWFDKTTAAAGTTKRAPAGSISNQSKSIVDEYGDAVCNARHTNQSSTSISFLLGPLASAWFRYDQLQQNRHVDQPQQPYAINTAPSSGLSKLETATSNCSCLTVNASAQNCCQRTFRGLFHKMGFALGFQLKQQFRIHYNTDVNLINWSLLCLRTRSEVTQQLHQTVDFREVLMVRNIYESLISGYLYHKSGRECWLDSNGKPYPRPSSRRGFVDWPSIITFPVAASWSNTTNQQQQRHGNRSMLIRSKWKHRPKESLCSVLARMPVKVGMRIYVEFIFRSLYRRDGFLEQLSMVHSDADFGRRVHILCFDDLANNDNHEGAIVAMGEALDFMFPVRHDGPNPMSILLENSSSSLTPRNYSGHATSHDANIRRELKRVIMKLDCEYYSGEIAFMDRLIPCGHG